MYFILNYMEYYVLLNILLNVLMNVFRHVTLPTIQCEVLALPSNWHQSVRNIINIGFAIIALIDEFLNN